VPACTLLGDSLLLVLELLGDGLLVLVEFMDLESLDIALGIGDAVDCTLVAETLPILDMSIPPEKPSDLAPDTAPAGWASGSASD
jgi:hypothetical protein